MARITDEQYRESLKNPHSRPVPDPIRYTFPGLLCHCSKCRGGGSHGSSSFLPIYINGKKYYYYNASAMSHNYTTAYQIILKRKSISLASSLAGNLTVREEILKSALISDALIAYALSDYPGWYLFRERRRAPGNPA
jgi:hypothetical protein